jgi:homoserine/homoserine lactone efflux protein
MPLDLFLAFLAASALLFAKPGPAMSVIVANSIGQGARGGLVTVAGNVIGFVLLISLVTLGLAWIAEAMKTWFDWIRLGGAVFLFYLGATRLWYAGKAGLQGPQPTGRLFRDGFLVAVANPEVILFLAGLPAAFCRSVPAGGAAAFDPGHHLHRGKRRLRLGAGSLGRPGTELSLRRAARRA